MYCGGTYPSSTCYACGRPWAQHDDPRCKYSDAAAARSRVVRDYHAAVMVPSSMRTSASQGLLMLMDKKKRVARAALIGARGRIPSTFDRHILRAVGEVGRSEVQTILPKLTNHVLFISGANISMPGNLDQLMQAIEATGFDVRDERLLSAVTRAFGTWKGARGYKR